MNGLHNPNAARIAYAATAAGQRNRLRTLDLLLSRRSTGALADPAPQETDLDLILEAGLRAAGCGPGGSC